jgi:antirestriction protein ArdC
MKTEPKADVYTRVTDKIIADLEQGVRPGRNRGTQETHAYKVTKTEANANGEEAEREIAFMKGYTVFNVDQMKTCPRNTRPSRNRHTSRPRSPSVDRVRGRVFCQDRRHRLHHRGQQPEHCRGRRPRQPQKHGRSCRRADGIARLEQPL